jgi:sulfonate transport system permease protein
MDVVEEEVTAVVGPDVDRTRCARGSFLLVPQNWQGAIVPLALLIAWEILSAGGILPANWLPAPSEIIRTLVDLTKGGELFGHIGITLARITSGFLIGATAATVLGGVAGSSPLFRRLFDPLLQSLRSIPSMAWVPLFLLWLGIHETSKITLIAVGVFFPVYLNFLSGILQVDRKLLEVGQIFKLNRVQQLRRVILPAALPAYLVGLRSGLGLGWMFVVAAEIMGASKGLGFLMIDGQMTGRASIIIASIILFALFGKLTDMAIDRAGRHLLRYQNY